MKVPRPALCAGLLLLAMLALPGGLPQAQAQAAEEGRQDIVRQVKAAYLFKFGGYVEWPSAAFADDSSPLVIGVVDADQIADEISRIAATRSIGKRPVRVKRLQRGEAPGGIHMLFVGQSANEPVTNWLAPVWGQPVLCVTEEETGPPSGSAINFVLDNNRVRFDVALPAAQHNKLELSALLLSAARKVEKDDLE